MKPEQGQTSWIISVTAARLMDWKDTCNPACSPWHVRWQAAYSTIYVVNVTTSSTKSVRWFVSWPIWWRRCCRGDNDGAAVDVTVGTGWRRYGTHLRSWKFFWGSTRWTRASCYINTKNHMFAWIWIRLCRWNAETKFGARKIVSWCCHMAKKPWL